MGVHHAKEAFFQWARDQQRSRQLNRSTTQGEVGFFYLKSGKAQNQASVNQLGFALALIENHMLC